MKEIIIELAQGQEYGEWFSHKCPICPDGRKRPILSIKREYDRVMSKCWSDKCPAHYMKTWYLNGNPEQIRDMILREEEKYSNRSRKYGLPGDISYDIPDKFIQYLSKYHIDMSLIRKYRLGYVAEHIYKDILRWKDRLVIPTPSGFVARSLDEQPKWRNYTDYDFILNTSKWYKYLVLCEDPLSTIRVGEIMPTMCLFGTKLQGLHEKEIGKYKEILIWLDGDRAGVKGALNIKKQLDPYVRCRIIQTKEDPKVYSTYEIKRILKENNNED